jgi:hypothetical protein
VCQRYVPTTEKATTAWLITRRLCVLLSGFKSEVVTHSKKIVWLVGNVTSVTARTTSYSGRAVKKKTVSESE